MTAETLLHEGRLEEALAALQADVRKNASDPKLRTFLFQLLCVLGRYDRAQTQLQVVGEMDPKAEPMVRTYGDALRGEKLRAEVFAGRRTPMILGEPAAWLAELVEALRCDADGNAAAALALRERAFDAAPTTAGELDGNAFPWIADVDARLGPVVEAIVNGVYRWIPFERIAAMAIEPPTDLRDLVWTPVWFTWTNGGTAAGLVPTRYPGTEASTDAALLLAKSTEWREVAPGRYVGLGLRMWSVGESDAPLTGVRALRLGDAAGGGDA